MNIAVFVKSAVDEAELRADASGHPVLKGAATKMSNFDRVGVEEAVRQREKHGGAVTVVSLGSADSKKAIKEAMAMGGDKAVLVLADTMPDAMGTAYLLAKSVQRLGGVDLILCSEGSSDTYQGQTGAMVAEFLGLPFLADAKRVELGDGKVRCDLRFEGGVRVAEADLPAVVSVVSEANQPRYPTLLQVMTASKKLIEEIQPSSLKGPDYPETGMEVLDITVQAANRKRVIFEGSPEDVAKKLVAALKQEDAL